MLQTKSGCLLVIVVIPIAIFVGNSIWNISRSMSVDKKYDFAMEQCEKYGGHQGEIPIFTEGVFDSKRVRRSNDILERASIFINKGLNYVEFNENTITLLGDGYPKESPYFKNKYKKYKHYRAYITEKGNSACAPYYYLQSRYTYYDEGIVGKESCVAIEGFDDPWLLKAPYQLLVAEKIIDEGVRVEWNNLLIIERRSQTVVASYNTFSHCFTDYQKNASQGFSYCRGIYSNEKVRPKCPAEYAKDAGVINQFEKSAFSYERDTD